MLYAFCENRPMAACDVVGLFGWHFVGDWDVDQAVGLRHDLKLIENSLGDVQARLLQLKLKMRALPDDCPLKALLLAGYDDLNGHIVDLRRKLLSDDIVELRQGQWDPDVSLAKTGYPLWVHVNKIYFNSSDGGFFDAEPDVRLVNVFHELFHLPGVGPSDPFNSPGFFDHFILNPKEFGLGGGIKASLIERVLGPGYSVEAYARLLCLCGGRDTLKEIF